MIKCKIIELLKKSLQEPEVRWQYMPPPLSGVSLCRAQRGPLGIYCGIASFTARALWAYIEPLRTQRVSYILRLAAQERRGVPKDSEGVLLRTSFG